VRQNRSLLIAETSTHRSRSHVNAASSARAAAASMSMAIGRNATGSSKMLDLMLEHNRSEEIDGWGT
jgi:hypothetical protein